MIKRLSNRGIPHRDKTEQAILSLPYPKLLNPMTKRGMLQDKPYWESYLPITNFRALVGFISEIDWPAAELLLLFNTLCRPYVLDHNIKYASLLIQDSAVPPHIDPPVRDLGINWYPFQTHGHTLTCDGQTIEPQPGDLIFLDVSKSHHTTHPTDDPIVFFSYTIHGRRTNDPSLDPPPSQAP